MRTCRSPACRTAPSQARCDVLRTPWGVALRNASVDRGVPDERGIPAREGLRCDQEVLVRAPVERTLGVGMRRRVEHANRRRDPAAAGEPIGARRAILVRGDLRDGGRPLGHRVEGGVTARRARRDIEARARREGRERGRTCDPVQAKQAPSLIVPRRYTRQRADHAHWRECCRGGAPGSSISARLGTPGRTWVGRPGSTRLFDCAPQRSGVFVVQGRSVWTNDAKGRRDGEPRVSR